MKGIIYMSEQEKNKPSEGGSQKSGNNNRHRYNRHRRGHHKPNNTSEKPASANTQAEAVAAKENTKPNQPTPKNRPSKKDSEHDRPQKPTEVSKAKDTPSEVKDGEQSKKRHQRNRRGNQQKTMSDSIAPTLFDTAPEDDLIFGKQSLFAKKEKTVSYNAEELDDIRKFTDEELFGTAHLITPAISDSDETKEVVSVRFKKAGKAYYFDPSGHKFAEGDFVVVETARGPEFGEISEGNRVVAARNIVQPLRNVIRPATREDIEKNKLNKKRELEAFAICLQKIAAHKLDMKLVDAQIAFDNSKFLFYFTSSGRVDFRELVRDLASVFKTRIELRQIGIRDEAKMLGGIGICGRPLCCSRFLGNFAQVSIKMAKEQGLSLNAGKISGNCGRLMCCLNFENQTYLDEIKLTPMPGSIVKIDGQLGTVTEATPLIGMLKVHLHNSSDGETVTVHRDSVSVIEKKTVVSEDNPQPEE